MKRIKPMSPDEFFYTWEPNDWPAQSPDKKTKRRFKRDLRRVGQWYILKDKFKSSIF